MSPKQVTSLREHNWEPLSKATAWGSPPRGTVVTTCCYSSTFLTWEISLTFPPLEGDRTETDSFSRKCILNSMFSIPGPISVTCKKPLWAGTSSNPCLAQAWLQFPGSTQSYLWVQWGLTQEMDLMTKHWGLWAAAAEEQVSRVNKDPM